MKLKLETKNVGWMVFHLITYIKYIYCFTYMYSHGLDTVKNAWPTYKTFN